MKLILEGFKKCGWCGRHQLRKVKDDGNHKIYDCNYCGARYTEGSE